MSYSFESMVVGEGTNSEVTTATVCGVGLDTVSAADATSLADAADIQSEMQNLVVEFDNGVARIEAVQDAADAADTAETAGEKLLEAAEAGEEPSVATVEAINLLLARAMKGTGKQQAIQMSTESFGVGRNRKQALKASAEGIMDTAKDLYKSAIEWIKKLIARVAEWFQATVGTAARMESAFRKVYAQILAKKDSDISKDLELSARRFAGLVHGDKASTVSGDVKLSEVLSNVAKNITNVGEVKTETTKVSNSIKTALKSAGTKKPELANVSVDKYAFGYTVIIKVEDDQIVANMAQAVEKSLVSADSKITNDGKKVGDLADAAKAGITLVGSLRKDAVLTGENKKVLEESLKEIEAASKKAGTGTGAGANLAKRDAQTRVKYLTALVKTGDGLYTKVAMSGAALLLTFLVAVSSKTEKAA